MAVPFDYFLLEIAPGEYRVVEEGNAFGKVSGDACIARYQDENGNEFSGVQGVAIWEAGNFVGVSECVPVSLAEYIVTEYISFGLQDMANWILISTNTLVNNLALQTSQIVAQVGGGGSVTGGFTDSDRGLLAIIHAKINTLTTKVNQMDTNISNKWIVVSNNILALQYSVEADLDYIIAQLGEGGGLTETGLLDGIGSLLDAGFDWVASLALEFTEAIGTLFSWADGLIAAMEQSFAARMSEVASTMTNTLQFMSSELFSGFSAIASVIEAPLSALGDIADFLFTELFDWLQSTFELDMKDVEEIGTSMIDVMKNILQPLKAQADTIVKE